MKINIQTYLDENFTCSECGWTGKGSQLSLGEFHEMSGIIDFECPKCISHIGSAAPIISDPEKYAKYLKGEIIDDPSTTVVYEDDFGRKIWFYTEKISIRLHMQDLRPDGEKEISIFVYDALKVCEALKCHRNDLDEKLLYSYYNEVDAIDVFTAFLNKNNIEYDYYSGMK
ncbi:MAG: hypothetical protein Q4G27_00670 [Flavobacteriaceae bacterium]|nr:hypothetical protein [Flavobacteriaceae bacterium]